MKDNFVRRDQTPSSASKRFYSCVVPTGSLYVDCHSSNVIYFITCNNPIHTILVKQREGEWEITELDSNIQINIDFVKFYLSISMNVTANVLLARSKYWKN